MRDDKEGDDILERQKEINGIFVSELVQRKFLARQMMDLIFQVSLEDSKNWF